MNSIDINHRSLGAYPSAEGHTHFQVWAPYVNSVAVVLPETGERFALKRLDSGYWGGLSAKAQSGTRYGYELDGENFLPDPASLAQPDGLSGPSQVKDLSDFQWTDSAWVNTPLKDFIIYELHIGTFSPEGNFEGLEAKLAYLKQLGITAIEIMPVASFPGERNWGYDGVFPYAVQESYGGAEGLQKLVNASHDQGLAVILDVVYNHFGPEGNVLDKFGPYFTEKYHTPWGSAINFDDAGSDAVRKYFIENTLMWFRDFHVDALRLDATHAMKDLGPVHILKEIRQQVDFLSANSGRQHYLIAEVDLNDNRYITPTADGGYGMDAQWIDEFHHALRVTSGNDRSGYYADFSGINHLAKALRDAYVYDGQYSPHRDKSFGSSAEGLPGERFVVFSQNHDHVGNRMLGERTGTLVSFEMQKVLAATVLVSPYLPLLFMGEEYGEKNPFLYFVDHQGPELIQAVREGRKREFAAFVREGEEVPDPQAESSFQNSKLNWKLLKNKQHAALLRYYQKLIGFRKTISALSHADRSALSVVVFEAKQVLVLSRWHGSDYIRCVFNFSGKEESVQIDFGTDSWKLLMNSREKQWLGNSENPKEIYQPNSITLPPETFMMFRNDHV